MTTVLHRRGWQFFVVADHNPPHVHAVKGELEIVVTLNPVAIWHQRGKASPADVRFVKRIAQENRQLFEEKWNELNQKRPE